ncbi:MAG: sulfotransferase domain-containing protein, partial [bacterium]|nr:sulfotransferase domain-containing protein [bacterium]
DNKKINTGIKEKHYADNIIIVASLPKSASSIISNCTTAIQTESNKDNKRTYGKYMVENADSDLRPELVRELPNGGVIKCHPRATAKNLKVLNLLNTKYIVLTRHPIDQVVALYWQHKKETNDNRGTLVYDHIYPIHSNIFSDGYELNKGIDYLLSEGYLYAVMAWIVDWLHFRNINRSIVVRYEDFLTNRENELNNISRFIQNRNANNQTISKCNTIVELATIHRHKKLGPNHPPSTGKIGAWRTNLSDENMETYLNTTHSFITSYPNSHLLLELYPDILNIKK